MTDDPLSRPCPSCHAAAGDRCRRIVSAVKVDDAGNTGRYEDGAGPERATAHFSRRLQTPER